MLQTFIITLREGVEAALVIAIAVSYLARIGRRDLFPTVYKAVVTALVASIGVAWLFTRIQWNQEAYEGWTQLVSAVFVFSMVVWMNRHARGVKGEIESGLQETSGARRARSGVFLFVFLMIFREGVETVLLLISVRFNTAGILEVFALCAGFACSILFGVSFVRGSIRINIGRFFRMTTVILMVVAVQLTITGFHELSEGGVLPSSREEMALIGPIVRHDVFFVVTILAMAAFLLLMDWRGRLQPRLDGLEGAALRKATWSASRERLWVVGSCAAATVFILALTAEFIYAKSATELSPATPLEVVDGRARIPVSVFSDGNLHRFTLQNDGVNIRMIVIRRPDQSLATALDACEICGSQGYYQDGANVICKNCASAIFVPTIGIAGGCNPVPLASRVEGDMLVVEAGDLIAGGRYFRH